MAVAAPWQHTAETAKHSLAAAQDYNSLGESDDRAILPPRKCPYANFTYGCVGFLDPGLGAPLIVVLGKTIQHVR